jgi:hypothetical protein
VGPEPCLSPVCPAAMYGGILLILFLLGKAWTTSENRDFELKNGSGFWGRGFIAGASYGGLEIKKPLMNFGVFVLQKARIYITLYVNKTYPFSPFRPRKTNRPKRHMGV